MDQNFLLKKAAEMRWNMMSKPSGLSGSRSRFLCSESPDVGSVAEVAAGQDHRIKTTARAASARCASTVPLCLVKIQYIV